MLIVYHLVSGCVVYHDGHKNCLIVTLFFYAASYGQSIFDLIISKTKAIGSNEHLVKLLKYLKPKGRLIYSPTNATQTDESLKENLKLNGFVNINVVNNGEFLFFNFF